MVCVCVFITVSHSIGLLVAADDWEAVLVRLAPVVKRPCLILTTTSPQPLPPPPPCYYCFAAGATTGPLHSSSGHFFFPAHRVFFLSHSLLLLLFSSSALLSPRPIIGRIWLFCVCFRNCSGLVSLFALSWATAMHRNILPYNKTIVNGCFRDLCYCLLLFVYHDFPLFSCFDISSLFFISLLICFQGTGKKAVNAEGVRISYPSHSHPIPLPTCSKKSFWTCSPQIWVEKEYHNILYYMCPYCAF